MDNLEADSDGRELRSADAWTRAIRRRSSDEDIRERAYENRHWMRYFGHYQPRKE